MLPEFSGPSIIMVKIKPTIVVLYHHNTELPNTILLCQKKKTYIMLINKTPSHELANYLQGDRK